MIFTGCLDCGANDMPLDTVLTGEQWAMICPDGGVLCASCIVKRAVRLPGVISTCLHIDFTEDFEGDVPGSKIWQAMKQLRDDYPAVRSDAVPNPRGPNAERAIALYLRGTPPKRIARRLRISLDRVYDLLARWKREQPSPVGDHHVCEPRSRVP